MFHIRGSRLDLFIKRAAVLAKRTFRETGGLIVDNEYFLDLVECKNKSRKSGSFAFYFREVREKVKAAEALGYEVVGTFHSHPFWVAKPGASDIENAVDDSLMLIIDCTNKKRSSSVSRMERRPRSNSKD